MVALEIFVLPLPMKVAFSLRDEIMSPAYMPFRAGICNTENFLYMYKELQTVPR